MVGELIVKTASEAWVKEDSSYMNHDPQFNHFFFDHYFIVRATGRKNQYFLAERGVFLRRRGIVDAMQYFLEIRSAGQFRLPNRGAIKPFYKEIKTKVGDSISHIKLTGLAFKVVFSKSFI